MTAETFEYAIKKDVRNNPIVREIDRERNREMVRSVGIGVFLVAVLLFWAWQQFELRRNGYRLEQMQQERAVEVDVNRHLRLEVQTLKAPERIERLALGRLRMVMPRPEDASVIERVVETPAPPRSVVARGNGNGRPHSPRPAVQRRSDAVAAAHARPHLDRGGRARLLGRSHPGAPRPPAGGEPRRARRQGGSPAVAHDRRLRPSAPRSSIATAVLASSVDADTIYAVPTEIADARAAARALCRALGDCEAKDERALADRLRSGKAFAYVRRQASPDQARRVAALELAGVGFLKESRRFYPNRDLAAHLLGYVGIDNAGLSGIEAVYDSLIRGQEGQVLVQIDAKKQAFLRIERPPTSGATLELTIDRLHAARRRARAAGGRRVGERGRRVGDRDGPVHAVRSSRSRAIRPSTPTCIARPGRRNGATAPCRTSTSPVRRSRSSPPAPRSKST